ncbi:hypothetical protein [Aquimarina algiphila]|uniref:Uncharacterized protein n=1 Tax=Aquimarina algiphila TaxID=2047982 RepID=A0A554VB70_9FLAO|nr:hypothetical protein [Aquimarina algiphila]TSE03690.1 hypothetical protein FOF46_28745 [Aquimarina algiphila]
MITSQDILNLNLKKVEEKSIKLKERIEAWITEYNQAKDKALFEKTSLQSRQKLYDMVSKYAPEAIKKTPSPKKEKQKEQTPKPKTIPKSEKKSKGQSKSTQPKGKLQRVVLLVIGDFKGLLKEAEELEIREDDIVIVMEMTGQLEKAIEEGNKEEVERLLDKFLLDYLQWELKMRNSTKNKEQEFGKKTTRAVNKLLEELGYSSIIGKPEKEILETISLRELVKTLSLKFRDWAAFLEGKDKEIANDAMLDLILTLSKEDEKEFRSQVKEFIEEYQHAKRGISNAQIADEADKLVLFLEKLWHQEKEDQSAKKTKEKGSSTGKKTQTTLLTEQLVQHVIDKLIEIEKDLSGHDETIVSVTRFDLEEALEEESGTQFRKKVLKAAHSFKGFVDDIKNPSAREGSITVMNKILNALGEPLLTKTGKERKETEEQRNQRRLSELEAIEPDLERCRDIIREVGRIEKAAKEPKPALSPYDKLSNRLISFGNIVLERHAKNENVLERTKEKLLDILKNMTEEWGMRDKSEIEKIQKKIVMTYDNLIKKLEKNT